MCFIHAKPWPRMPCPQCGEQMRPPLGDGSSTIWVCFNHLDIVDPDPNETFLLREPHASWGDRTKPRPSGGVMGGVKH